jgi:threonylcarbamoyladenosine tRNA methylthiotransferase MtaB
VPSFYIENFGCRAAQADGASISRQLTVRGLEPASADAAQLVILNTCTVTADADRAARAAVRRIHSHNPCAKILVTGCYAQRAPAELATLSGVTWVVGNSHKHAIAATILPDAPAFVPLHALTQPHRPEVYVGDIFAHTELLAAPVCITAETKSGDSRTRPNLKVQDGCDNRCSFCVIPSVRGQSRSRSLPQVIDDINALVAAGSREVVISGINLGRWGRDLTPAARFETLVEAILQQTPLEKLRLSSVEPMDWTDDLIALIRSAPRIARHAHVPMQSGSDSVLRRMHRKYRPWHYRAKITKIREALPTAAIGADVMTGFPGETDAEFDETRRMVEDLPLTYLHIFPYSPRPGTPAAALPDQVPVPVARERHHVLRDLIFQKKQSFAQSFVGQTLPAITLLSSSPDSPHALTDNYLELRLAVRHQPNCWLQARITASENGRLTGILA